jgi:hypothetical protein
MKIVPHPNPLLPIAIGLGEAKLSGNPKVNDID